MEVFNLYQAVWRLITGLNGFLTVAGQSVEHLTAEWEVAGSIPVTDMRNGGTLFALQAAWPSRGSGDHVKWGSRLQ